MRQILPAINLNGKIVHQKSAKISVLNEGFLYGLGVFTTIKVREGVPLFLDRHLARLESSAHQLGHFSFLISHFSFLKNAVYATIAKNNLINGGLRITLTPSIFYIHAFTISQEIPPPPLLKGVPKAGDLTIQQFNNEAIKLITLPDPRDIYKTIKTTYRLPQLLARQQAKTKGAQDALFTQNNKLIESTSANVISCTPSKSQLSTSLPAKGPCPPVPGVGRRGSMSRARIVQKGEWEDQAGQLSIITPPIKGNGLNGITRQILIENLPIQETPIPANTNNPLILVNSLGFKIVESIDGRKLNQNPEFINLIRQTLNKAEKIYIDNNRSKI